MTSQYGEFFWPFIAGAKLVMVEPERTATARDATVLLRNTASRPPFCAVDVGGLIASLTPASAGKSCLKSAFSVAARPSPTALCREWETLTNAPLHNLYGPTGGRGG
ncbi:hypothetical protein KCP74_23635 [Salmonella enterica subsp. enterica]|nr:hypothetical protein KCP74_23635 [Salmonella enterica subsp. enterica]